MSLRNTLKEYLQQPYQGVESFLENVIYPVFGEEYYEDSGSANVFKYYPDIETLARESGILAIKQIGRILVEGSELFIFDIQISSHRQLTRSRVSIQTIIRRLISNHSGAFMIFHYETMVGRWDWRFSYCYKGKTNVEATDAKRYTFLLGPGQSCRTAADNFLKIHDKIEQNGEFEMDDIVRAFDVEALSKEFFSKYKSFYSEFVAYMCDEANGMRQDFIATDFDSTNLTAEQIREREEKPIRDYVKKLLGRLVFIQFLQKKGWMGVPGGKDWGEGDYDFLRQLYLHADKEQKENFLDGVLEPLFSALDSKRANDEYDTHIQLAAGSVVRVPYLNGGLFERDRYDEPDTVFPADYFKRLLEFFYEYNFTIDENDPNDAEVGIDAEMLGKIFENLLEDNKDKGAFYTPKEIVQYMCRESLIAYLQKGIESEVAQQELRDFVLTNQVEHLQHVDPLSVDRALRDVKICDPAIGSGAFPMGLLRELYNCRLVLEPEADMSVLKKEIIQNNIYGVDIEKGAIDIARLRFWLSIIVDADKPEPLPNFDYKFMQGNSLLEQYKGIDLSGASEAKTEMKGHIQISIFDDNQDIYRGQLKTLLHQYFDCSDHTKRNELRRNISGNVRTQIAIENPQLDLSEIDPAGNDQFFLWHTWFKDVFDEGGFDIVIGNPPYISALEAKKILSSDIRNAYKRAYESASGTYDMYVIFIELGLKLLRVHGHLSFITPSKYLSAEYASALRSYIINGYSLDQVCDFSNVKVFESAGVSTIISQLSKRSQGDSVCFTTYKTLTIVGSTHVYDKKVLSLLPNNLWGPLLSPNIKVFFKIFEQSVTVESCAEVNACSTAAEADVYEGNLIESQLKNSFKYINNGTINRYVSFWGYKVIRKNKMITPYLPYSALSERRIKMFQKKKLIFVKLAKCPEVFLDECGEYGSANTNMVYDVKGYDYKFLLAFFNSAIFNFVYRTMFGGLSMLGSVQMQAPQIRKSLIPRLDVLGNINISDIIGLVNEIIKEKEINKDADTSALETKIDRLVYELYGLTNGEVKIIDPEAVVSGADDELFKA